MSSPSSGGEPSGGSRRPRRRGERGATAFENIIVTLVVGILITVVFSYYRAAIRLSRETALQGELRNIRTAVSLFVTLNRRFPESLEALIDREYVSPHEGYSIETGTGLLESGQLFRHSYLEARSRDAEGRLLDPFGETYRYDPARGLVTAGAAAYRNW